MRKTLLHAIVAILLLCMGTSLQAAITFQTLPQGATVGVGQSYTFAVVGQTDISGGKVTNSWTKDGNVIPKATSSSLTISKAQISDAGNYVAILNDGVATNTPQVALTVLPKPTIDTPPTARTIVEVNGSATLSVSATGTSMSYFWFRSGTVQGSTSNSCPVDCSIPGAFRYSISVSNVAGAVVNTNALVIVVAKPTISNDLTNKILAAGSNYTFRVASSNMLGSYQWYYNITNTLTSNTNSYTVASSTTMNSGTYSLVMSNMSGSVTSAVATLTVLDLPSISVQPTATNMVALGATVNLSVTASGSALTYQWGKRPAPAGKFAPITGATGPSLGLTNVAFSDAGFYSVLVSNAVKGVLSSNSDLVVIGAPVFANKNTLTNKITGLGSNYTFYANCTNVQGSYFWYFNATNALVSTSNTYPLISANFLNSGAYSLLLSNVAGWATSSVATLTVLRYPRISNPPVATNTVALGGHVDLSITASGSLLAYQWSKRGTSSYAPIAGATNATLSLTNVALADAGTYAITVSNALKVLSNSTLVVVIRPPAFAFVNSLTNKALAIGSNYTFKVNCTNIQGSYFWYFNATNALVSTSNTCPLVNATLSNAGAYSVILSNLAGWATSSVAMLKVMQYPGFTSQPAATNIVPKGSTVNLSVEVVGGSLSYQWFVGGKKIAGETESSLRFYRAVVTNSGIYTIVISNAVGKVTSSNSILSVIPPPAITTYPKSKSLIVGQDLVLSVVATGTKPLFTNLLYQWNYNTTNLLGNATNATYVVPSAFPTNAGCYAVTITNFGGAVTTTNVTVTVRPDTNAPTLTVAGSAKTVITNFFRLTGTTKDDVRVTNVVVQLNASTNLTRAQTTNTFTKWSSDLRLIAGTNKVVVVATDFSGNVTTNKSSIYYAPIFDAVLTAIGDGEVYVLGWTNRMQYGVSYKLKAVAPARSVFWCWRDFEGITMTNRLASPSITVLVTNTVETNTIALSFGSYTNYFYDGAGEWNGLITGFDRTFDHQSSGFISFTLTTNLYISGKIVFAGETLRYAGPVSPSGEFYVPFGNHDVALRMTFDIYLSSRHSVGGSVWGTVLRGTNYSRFQADPCPFSKTNPAKSYAGSYTFAIPPDTANTNSPATNGYGYAIVNISSNGTFVLSGQVADGSVLSQSGVINYAGKIPFFVPLYGKDISAGEIMGWINCSSRLGAYGTVDWERGALPGATLYPNGFTNYVHVIGSCFKPPTKAQPRILNTVFGAAYFSGGGLTNMLSDWMLFGDDGAVHCYNSGMSMTMGSSGLVSGKFINPATAAPIKFSGVAIQYSSSVFGFFGTNSIGSVEIDPQ